MSPLKLVARRPICLSCSRRLDNLNSFNFDTFSLPTSSQIQVRGKKKLRSRPANLVDVRLLVDIKGYGKKGTITPVARGLMRNQWFHNHRAEYLATCADILDIKKVESQRDFLFGLSQDEISKQKRPEQPEAVSKPRIRLLSAEETVSLLTELLPSRLVFNKAAINPSAPAPSRSDPTSAPQATKAISEAAAELNAASLPPSSSSPNPTFTPIPIFGSVTPSEIAISFTASLQAHPEASRILISAGDVTIVSRADIDNQQSHEQISGGSPSSKESINRIGIEDGRIKALGEYWVEIRTRGAMAALPSETEASVDDHDISDSASSSGETKSEIEPRSKTAEGNEEAELEESAAEIEAEKSPLRHEYQERQAEAQDPVPELEVGIVRRRVRVQ